MRMDGATSSKGPRYFHEEVGVASPTSTYSPRAARRSEVTLARRMSGRALLMMLAPALIFPLACTVSRRLRPPRASSSRRCEPAVRPPRAKPLEQLQRDFVDLRFGMFLHFGILTYTGRVVEAEPRHQAVQPDRSRSRPVGRRRRRRQDEVRACSRRGITTASRCGQAAPATSTSATSPGAAARATSCASTSTPSAAAAFCPASTTRSGTPPRSVSAGQLTPAKLAYVKTQLTELLTNYGPIPILIIDGWSWQMGHNAVAYQEIRGLVKSLQPDCLLTDHAHLADPWDMDIVNFEEPRGGWAPAGNTYPAQQEQKVNATGGNDWFWAPDVGGLMTRRRRWSPGTCKIWNRSGPTSCSTVRPTATASSTRAIVALLHEVGAAWTPNPARPPLPAQPPQNERPYTPVVGDGQQRRRRRAIDGKNDTDFISMWQPTGALPQAITLDLGRVQPDVGWLGCVPRYHHEASSKDGNVTDVPDPHQHRRPDVHTRPPREPGRRTAG